MPMYRYNGPSHLFKLNEEDEGTPKGGLGNFSKAVVDKYTKRGHRFTAQDELKPAAVAEAKTATIPDTAVQPVAKN